LKLSVMAGAGNTFAVVDAEREALPSAPPLFAQRLCAEGAPAGLPRLDGLLLVSRGERGGDCRMTVFNADGSRPEACGNGLRCVARFAREHGYAREDRLRVETDAGPRPVELLRDPRGAIVAARASMGAPRRIERDVPLRTSRGEVRATLVDMGNPHCVLLVDDERAAPVAALGGELELHSRFPRRANVGFAAWRDGRLHLRVWERGVGETAACGTGACAAAVAARLERGLASPVEVRLPGGLLTVEWDGAGDVRLTGPCELLWSGEVELAGSAPR
jgi:diaminopimelate epimerase